MCYTIMKIQQNNEIEKENTYSIYSSLILYQYGTDKLRFRNKIIHEVLMKYD